MTDTLVYDGYGFNDVYNFKDIESEVIELSSVWSRKNGANNVFHSSKSPTRNMLKNFLVELASNAMALKEAEKHERWKTFLIRQLLHIAELPLNYFELAMEPMSSGSASSATSTRRSHSMSQMSAAVAQKDIKIVLCSLTMRQYTELNRAAEISMRQRFPDRSDASVLPTDILEYNEMVRGVTGYISGQLVQETGTPAEVKALQHLNRAVCTVDNKLREALTSFRSHVVKKVLAPTNNTSYILSLGRFEDVWKAIRAWGTAERLGNVAFAPEESRHDRSSVNMLHLLYSFFFIHDEVQSQAKALILVYPKLLQKRRPLPLPRPADGGKRPRVEDKKCYNCGKKGHVYRDCPSPRSVKCYNCNKEGHISRDCPSPKKVRTTK